MNPTLALAALACVAAPIIIHLLFRRKRRPVEWGAMKFVLEAFRRHRKRLRLEQILLLAARTLAVLCLALAVGRPMFAGARPADSLRARDLTIVIDNSLAAGTRANGAGNAGKTELEASKERAAALLERLDPARGDRANIITLAAPAERLLPGPSGDLAGVRRALELVEPADSGADFVGAGALTRDGPGLGEKSEGKRDATIALVSGLRSGSADTSREVVKREISRAEPSDDLPSVLAASPATSEAPNYAIVSIEPLRSMLLRTAEGAATQQARVTIRRFGAGVESAGLTQLRMRVTDGRDGEDDRLWAKSAVRFSPGEDTVSVLAPVAMRNEKEEGAARAASGGSPASWIEGRIDDDAIAGDNVFRRPWRVREQLRVGVLAPIESGDAGRGPAGYSGADWLTLALAPASSTRGVELESETEAIRIARIDPARMIVQDLAVLDAAFLTRPDLVDGPGWALLGDFARRGGLLVVCAAPVEGVQKWTDDFAKATGLAWVFARESTGFSEAPLALREANTDQPIIAALGADLLELIKPVAALRLLPVDLKGDGAWLLRFDENRPMLAASRPGSGVASAGETKPPAAGAAPSKGLVVGLFVAPELGWTNLPAMPLMVPLVQEIVRQGVGLAGGSIELIAGSVLEAPDELRALVPAESGAVPAVARRAGIWRRVDAKGATRDLVAVNADTRGSGTATQQKAALEPFLTNWVRGRDFAWDEPGEVAGGRGGGTHGLGASGKSPPVDLPLLALGLLFLLLDVIFSRLFSHATMRDDRATLQKPGDAARRAAA